VPVAVLLGGLVLSIAPAPLGPATGSYPSLRVAIVQGAVPDRGLAFEDRARQVLDNHVRETFRLAAEVSAGRVPRPQLVVWPENSSDVDPYRDATAAAEITSAVRAVGAPVLVGAILQGPGAQHRRNVGILWSPTTGPGARYVKRHPVPFAEYMPLRAVADGVSSAAKLVTQDMVRGTGDGLLRGGPVPLGDVICFEVAYDGLVRSSVSAGARLFVVQTNNATFGHTSETYQQLAMSRLRAVETGRTVLQASTTGISAVLSPTGSVLRSADRLFQPAILTASVPLRSGLTPAVRLGAAPEIVLSAAALAGLAWSLLGARPRRRSRRQPEAAPAVDPVGVR
jgi:apolipoprotein N-acyltransferase